jgi:hypothetical protein
LFVQANFARIVQEIFVHEKWTEGWLENTLLVPGPLVFFYEFTVRYWRWDLYFFKPYVIDAVVVKIVIT